MYSIKRENGAAGMVLRPVKNRKQKSEQTKYYIMFCSSALSPSIFRAADTHPVFRLSDKPYLSVEKVTTYNKGTENKVYFL